LGTQANDFATTAQRGAGGRSPTIRGWEGTISFEGGEIVVRPVGGVARAEKRVAIERGESEAEHWKDFFPRAGPGAGVADRALQVQTALQMVC
jgi:hypothetical protein